MAKKPSAKQVAADRLKLHDHCLDNVLAQFGVSVGDMQRMFGERPSLRRYGSHDFSDMEHGA